MNDALKQGGRSGTDSRGRNTRDALVVIEVASALVLLIGAGLMIQTMAKLRSIDIGFRSDHVASVDPEQPVSALRTMDEIVALNVADRQQQMTLLGAFSGLALVLACIGLYGVLSYAVTQRSREIGLRMALGASAASVIRMIVGRGLALTGTGLALGAA